MPQEVRCAFAGEEPRSSHLARSGHACRLGTVYLEPEGDVTKANGDRSPARWTATKNAIEVCVGSECFQCTSTERAPGSASPKAGRCTGVAPSCHYQPAGSCESIQGCRFEQHTHIGWNNQLEMTYECEGSSDSCDGFDTEASCQRQGCSWQ